MKHRTALLLLIPLAFALADDAVKPAPAGPPFNVRAFGARGDGNNHFDDSAAIQACIDAAGSGKVTIPAGSYRCLKGLTIRGTTGTVIEGDGASTRLFFEGTFDEAIRCENNALLTIRDLRIQGPATVKRGLHVTQKDASAEGTFLENLHVEGFTDAICIGADTDGDVAEVTVLHCWAVNAKNAGFCCGNGTGGNVLDIRFLGCVARRNAYGVFASGTTFTWRDGSTGYNGVDFAASATVAPLVISGVRTENSGRFFEMSPGSTFGMPVTLENIYIPNFTDPDGCPIDYRAACPLTLRNVVMRGGPRPAVMRLGFSPDHPLIATLDNVVSDSPSPFGTPGPHQQFAIIGGGTIGPDWRATGNRNRGIVATGLTLDSSATLEFGDGRRWTPGGQVETQTHYWVDASGKMTAAIWEQGGDLWCQTLGPPQPGRGGINGNPAPPPRVVRLSKP